MSTNALNPALPTGANQVELTSELRGIKTRLVADKASIETLQTQVIPVTSAGAVGLQILADVTVNDVLADLAVTAIGKSLMQDYLDLPTLKAYLGIIGAATEVVTTGATWANIVFPGGFKIKVDRVTIPGGGGTYAGTWNTPFSTLCIGALITRTDSGDQASWLVGAPTVTGYEADHNNGSAKAHVIIGIGI